MNEIDHELERRLRTHFRDARAEDLTPAALRTAVLAIPQAGSEPRVSHWSRSRGLTLLAATLALGTGALGWALLGGSRVPEPNPSPRAYAVAPSPSATTAPTDGPGESPSSPTPSDGPGPRVPVDAGPGIAVGWLPAGSMADARMLPTATLLRDGRVLVVGGFDKDGAPLASAEIWDPATRTFSPTGSMSRARGGQAAALLNDGRVLIVGGDDQRELGTTLDTEVWDPATGQFEVDGTMPAIPSGLTATTLLDGRVLIVRSGGCTVPLAARVGGRPTCRGQVADSWLWDPAGTWTVGPAPSESRMWHTATLLPDGRVLIAGNESWSIGNPEASEVYDPSTNAFLRVGAPQDLVQGGQSATLLPDGRVLITGGDTSDPNGDPHFMGPLRTAETWDPATGAYTRAGTMDVARRAHQAALLPDGRVLVVGGSTPRTATFNDPGTATTEIWDPATGSFIRGPDMAEPRADLALVTLANGDILAIGGASDINARAGTMQTLSTAELLDFSPSP